MSAGYAARLKDYPNKGVCGLREMSETARAYKLKVQQLASMMQQSKNTVVLTGAGISTAAGIPDFRGPKGIWTIENQKQNPRKTKSQKRKRTPAKLEEESSDNVTGSTANVSLTEGSTVIKDETNDGTMDFASARPTFTHRSITRLVTDGLVQFVVTQNVDGLHRRSGLSRNHHAILHGCAFTEACSDCGTEHFRDTDVGGMSFQTTGRTCDLCSGALRDTLLDWEDPLPVDDLKRSEQQCAEADLAICLGTSLRIQPASELPLESKQMVIVNLQITPMDQFATLIIRERVDNVMEDVLKQLGYSDWESDKDSPPIERLWSMSRTCTKEPI